MYYVIYNVIYYIIIHIYIYLSIDIILDGLILMHSLIYPFKTYTPNVIYESGLVLFTLYIQVSKHEYYIQ